MPSLLQSHIADSCSTWCSPEASGHLFEKLLFHLISSYSVLLDGVVLPQVHDLAVPLVEHHDVPVSPFLQLTDDGSMTF